MAELAKVVIGRSRLDELTKVVVDCSRVGGFTRATVEEMRAEAMTLLERAADQDDDKLAVGAKRILAQIADAEAAGPPVAEVQLTAAEVKVWERDNAQAEEAAEAAAAAEAERARAEVLAAKLAKGTASERERDEALALALAGRA